MTFKELIKGFRGHPKDTNNGFLWIQERYLANDKQLHLAGSIVLAPICFGLLIDMYDLNKWFSVIITMVVIWGIGYLIELFQKYVLKKVLNHYDAAIMGIGALVIGLLMAFIITLRIKA